MRKIHLRAWISIATFILIGVILYFSRKELAHAWHLINSLDWRILILIIPAILLGYLATGEMIFSYLRQKKLIKHVSLWEQMRISLELNFVNHVLPSGGLSGVSYMNWRLGKYGISGGRSTMAQVVRYTMGFAAMIVLLIAAVLFVTIDGAINRWLILMSSGLVTFMVIIVMILVMILNRPEKMRSVSQWVARIVNRLVKSVTFGRVSQVLKPIVVQKFLDDIREDYVGLMKEKKVLLQPFLWGIFFTSMEVMIFWIVFWALGSPVNPAPILIGYGIASATGFIIIAPGGVGAYEAVMVLVLGLSGMAQGEAIAGILLARVVILLVTIIFGYILYQQVLIKYGKRPDTSI